MQYLQPLSKNMNVFGATEALEEGSGGVGEVVNEGELGDDFLNYSCVISGGDLGGK